ncbi:MAG: hypothetical protein EAZ27_07760 [Cytophagales bacterium]|nr:MAG: hypothetical protein EAZ27_07760 [Cytophagales bacterium]
MFFIKICFLKCSTWNNFIVASLLYFCPMEIPHLLYYERYYTPLGNTFQVHSTHKGEELVKNTYIAEFLIDKFGGDLRLLPNQINDPLLYNLLMPFNTKFGKFSDAFWNNEIWEFKTNTTGKISTLRKEIEKAHKQAYCVVIRFDFSVSTKEIYRAVKGEIISTNTLEKVWVIQNKKILKFNRNQLIKKPRNA